MGAELSHHSDPLRQYPLSGFQMDEVSSGSNPLTGGVAAVPLYGVLTSGFTILLQRPYFLAEQIKKPQANMRCQRQRIVNHRAGSRLYAG